MWVEHITEKLMIRNITDENDPKWKQGVIFSFCTYTEEHQGHVIQFMSRDLGKDFFLFPHIIDKMKWKNVDKIESFLIISWNNRW